MKLDVFISAIFIRGALNVLFNLASSAVVLAPLSVALERKLVSS